MTHVRKCNHSMEKYFDINERGFSVRCKLYFKKNPGDVKRIVISTHGFGGNKENKSAMKFAGKLYSKFKDFGVIVFDWPCHGADARNKLLLEDCLTYLDLVINHAKNSINVDEIYNYSMSFGAYVTLLYIHKNGNPFRKIALRSPSIKIYNSIMSGMSDDQLKQLAKGHEVLKGYERKLRISNRFTDALKENDLMKMDFIDFADDILMLHGTADDLVPVEDSIEFSEQNVIELIKVPKANHIFQDPKTMDFAIHTIIEFFGQ